MSKLIDKDLTGAFGGTEEPKESIPFEESLEPKEVPEYTDNDLALLKLGIVKDYIKTLTKGWVIWCEKNPDEEHRIFNKAGNPTPIFWNFTMDILPYVYLNKIDLELLPKKLKEMTMKQIEFKRKDIGEATENVYKALAERLIKIFIEQNIKAKLTKKEIQLIKELNEECQKNSILEV